MLDSDVLRGALALKRNEIYAHLRQEIRAEFTSSLAKEDLLHCERNPSCLLKLRLVARVLRLSYPSSERPLAHQDFRKELRGSPSCHKTNARRRAAHR